MVRNFSRMKKIHFIAGAMVAQLFAPCQGWASALPRLIEDVFISHPSVRAQQALGRSSQEAAKAARWQYYPTPSVSIEGAKAARTDLSYAGDDHVTILRLQQPLWTGGRLTAGVDKAEAGILASQASLENTRLELTLRVVQAYSDWLGSHHKINAYEKSLQAHTRLRQKIVRRIEEGISPQVDLTLVVGRTEQTDAELSVAKAQQAAALTQLSQLVGHPVQAADLSQAISSPVRLGESQQVLLERAQAGNPGVARLLATVRIQEAEIAERKADMSPEVYLRAERQYGNFSYAGRPPENRIFLGVSTRFGAGLSSISQVGGAQARYDAALADVESTRVSLGAQVMADYMLAESGQRRLLLLDASLRSAEAISQAWDRQFLAGHKSWLDVMNAVRELAQVEIQIADVKAAQLLLTWRLAIYARGVDAVIAQDQEKVSEKAQ